MFGGILGMMDMMDDYKERKVKRFEKDKLVVDTARVTDSTKPFETAVEHPDYKSGEFIVVENYDTKEDAEKGHERWVMTMTAETLPEELRDVSESTAATDLDDVAGNKGWRTYPRKKKAS
jgi:hypothetical protein